jgi:hypothetical protein
VVTVDGTAALSLTFERLSVCLPATSTTPSQSRKCVLTSVVTNVSNYLAHAREKKREEVYRQQSPNMTTRKAK